MTLIFFRIGVPFEIAEEQASPSWHDPLSFCLVVLCADLFEDLLRSRNRLVELLEAPPEEYADGGFPMPSWSDVAKGLKKLGKALQNGRRGGAGRGKLFCFDCM